MVTTAGDTHLGGDDFDKRIVDRLANEFKARDWAPAHGDGKTSNDMDNSLCQMLDMPGIAVF